MGMLMSDVLQLSDFVCTSCQVKVELLAILVDSAVVELRIHCPKCGETAGVIFDGFKPVKGKSKDNEHKRV